MSYEKITIKKLVDKVNNNEVYLPAIQRKFIWRQEQIEIFFDSLLRGYPIGTFLFWYIRRPNIDNYVFYKFLLHYHEKERYLNERAPNPELRDEIIGILDGQQRISSLYLALQGTYSVKKPYYEDYPARILHLNLISQVNKEEDDEVNYSFKFITSDDAQKRDENTLWFKVRDVLTWDVDSPPIDEFYDKLVSENSSIKKLLSPETRNSIKRTIRDLHSRLVRDDIINYFITEEQDLDNILKMFVRVNSGGTILSKTDLLFSTIVANWEDGRDEIEKFLIEINKIGDTFKFTNDFLMRGCLMLTDCDILFKVGSFRRENVDGIRNKWEDIKTSIRKTVQIVAEFGMNGTTLSSQNSILPIAYYIMNDGEVNIATKKEIKKYLFHALLKGIFSGQGDAVLSNFRNYLKKNTKEDFSFDKICNIKLTSNKSLRISDDDIEEFLNYKKGNSTFILLTFLYPNLRYGQVRFHQDHIHPVSLFTNSKMKEMNIPNDNYTRYKEYKDTLPNLQLLEGSENLEKSRTLFVDWISKKSDLDRYLDENFIDRMVSFKFEDFIQFYEARKALLRLQLKIVLL